MALVANRFLWLSLFPSSLGSPDRHSSWIRPPGPMLRVTPTPIRSLWAGPAPHLQIALQEQTKSFLLIPLTLTLPFLSVLTPLPLSMFSQYSYSALPYLPNTTQLHCLLMFLGSITPCQKPPLYYPKTPDNPPPSNAMGKPGAGNLKPLPKWPGAWVIKRARGDPKTQQKAEVHL